MRDIIIVIGSGVRDQLTELVRELQEAGHTGIIETRHIDADADTISSLLTDYDDDLDDDDMEGDLAQIFCDRLGITEEDVIGVIVTEAVWENPDRSCFGKPASMSSIFGNEYVANWPRLESVTMIRESGLVDAV